MLIGYLLLVGVPLVMLLAVLRKGKAVSAPASVQGEWWIALDHTSGGRSSCDVTLQAFDGAAIRISQSGSYLEAKSDAFPPGVLRGRGKGMNLWFESALHDSSMLNGDLVRLVGAVSDVEGSRVMRGTLLMPRQVDCTPRGFEAVLSADSRGGQARTEEGHARPR